MHSNLKCVELSYCIRVQQQPTRSQCKQEGPYHREADEVTAHLEHKNIFTLDVVCIATCNISYQDSWICVCRALHCLTLALWLLIIV